MRGLLLIFAIFGLAASGALGETRFFAPVFLRPGSVNEAYAWDEAPLEPFTVEVWRPGAKTGVLGVRGFPVNRLLPVAGREGKPLNWAAALVCPEALEDPGPVTIRFVGPGKKILAEFSSEIKSRTFVVETIPLDRVMTGLREKPDARKDREAEVIWGVYLTFHPEVAWQGGRFVRPVDLKYPVSAQFGDTRKYVYTDGTTARDYHRGIDFAVPKGTEVRSPGAGKVALVADRMLTGTTVVLEHAPGFYSVYFHLSQATVTIGQTVAAGDLLALSGATGLVTGPHLHWEFRCGGVSVDPADLVSDGLLDTTAVGAVISSIERSIH